MATKLVVTMGTRPATIVRLPKSLADFPTAAALVEFIADEVALVWDEADDANRTGSSGTRGCRSSAQVRRTPGHHGAGAFQEEEVVEARAEKWL